MGPPSTEDDAASLETKLGESKIAVVFCGEGGDEFTAFEKAAGADDKRTFFHTSDAAAAKAHGATAPAVVLFRDFDEPKVTFDGKYEQASINEWIASSSVPTLIEFSDEYIEPIFQN